MFSPDQLKDMAHQWIADRKVGGEQSFLVAISISIKTGMPPIQVAAHIKRLAE